MARSEPLGPPPDYSNIESKRARHQRMLNSLWQEYEELWLTGGGRHWSEGRLTTGPFGEKARTIRAAITEESVKLWLNE